MSRFVLITPNSDFERRVRMATAGMTGSLQYFAADYLPQGPEEVLGSSSASLRKSSSSVPVCRRMTR